MRLDLAQDVGQPIQGQVAAYNTIIAQENFLTIARERGGAVQDPRLEQRSAFLLYSVGRRSGAQSMKNMPEDTERASDDQPPRLSRGYCGQ
jgi:hypothetical protein